LQQGVERVVLVDEANRVLGTMPKHSVHQFQTPLHRGFSSFIFRVNDGSLLVQQRSSKKRTWPLIWSNSCCGHPALGETTLAAARRRLRAELDLAPVFLEEVAPYRYCLTRDGVTENEICPILVGIVDSEPIINPNEVEAVRWLDWHGFLDEIDRAPAIYSGWCVEEAKILAATPRFKEILAAWKIDV